MPDKNTEAENKELAEIKETVEALQKAVASTSSTVKELAEIKKTLETLNETVQKINREVFPAGRPATVTTLKPVGDRTVSHRGRKWKFANKNMRSTIDTVTSKKVVFDDLFKNPRKYAAWLDALIDSGSSLIYEVDAKTGKPIVQTD